MWKFVKTLLTKKQKISDLTPKGFKTTYKGAIMTIEEKNENFKQMFEFSRKQGNLSSSDYK